MSSSIWQRVKTGSKTSFDKAWKAADKLGTPVNNLSNKLGSEAFWPTTLDRESDKAARILKSFCKDGFYAEEDRTVQDGPKQKQKVFKKIPSSVIKNAKGLAIFTTMRTGLWFSGAGGSGILIARQEDGSWSPPSGILLHTAGLGFLVGVDIYDCVVVINTATALEAFTKIRCTLGSEISVAAGPVGAGGVLDTELHKRQAPIFTYLKSRGFYAGVQIDGTVIIERTDENERFYGQRIPVADILAGKVRHPPYEVRRLLETVRAAQGDSDVDESILPTEPPPGDYEIDNGHIFGVPDKEDPDPYGVLALEKEGMSVKEAGTHKRASWETFNFNPSPTSPVHDMVRNSIGHELGRSTTAAGKRNSWRASGASDFKSPSLRTSAERRRSAVTMADTSTQTDDDNGVLLSPVSPPSSPGSQHRSVHSPRSSRNSLAHSIPENAVLQVRSGEPESASKANGYTTPPHTPPLNAAAVPPALPPRSPGQSHGIQKEQAEKETDDDKAVQHDEEDEEEIDEEDDDAEDEDLEHHDPSVIQLSSASPAIVHSVHSASSSTTASGVATAAGAAATPQVISKPRIVDVPKRLPPKLPPRNPNRGAAALPTASAASSVNESAATSVKDDGSREGSPGREVEIEEVVREVQEAEEKHDSAQEIRLEDHDVQSDGLGEEGGEEAPRKNKEEEAASTTSATGDTSDGVSKKREEEGATAAAMPGGW